MRIKYKLFLTATILAVTATIYASMYFAMSSSSQQEIDGSVDVWTTREFSRDWQITFFKPLLALENAICDGDFSWGVNRAL